MTTSNSENDFDKAKDSFEQAAEDLGNEAKKAANNIREEWNDVTNSQENKKIFLLEWDLRVMCNVMCN